MLVRGPDGNVAHDFNGRLRFSWPADPLQTPNVGDTAYAPLFPYGFGLRYGDAQLSLGKLDETDATRELPSLGPLPPTNPSYPR